MKKLLLSIFAILLSLNALAQLEVKEGSFKEVKGFVNINTDKMYDDNEKPYAVLKIKTVNISSKQRRELNFGGDARTYFEVEYKDGEVWLYISYYASFIKISHEEMSSTEFYFPFDLQPKKGYELTLVNKSASLAPVKDVYNFMIVSADQSNATIYIDNEYVGEQEVYKSFKAGEKHVWRIECELYHTENGEAVIPNKEGENITVNKTLRPAFGYLNVTSTPEDGAVVFVDGKKVGQTPYKSDKLASGEHKVRVMKEMFSTVEKTFTVNDGQTINAPMNMSANFVSVTITTDSESEIYVDNEKKGKGTWSGRLSDGEHALEARKVSHKPTIKNVQLVLGKNETLVIPNPEPICGTLEVVSNPIGANIIIDGKDFGTTPRVLANVLIGTHELRLEKTGCAPVAKTITLDETNKLSINEKLSTGREIAITTDGTGDKIFVDGNYIGDSPLTTTLSFGEHEIAAIRGYSGDINALKDLNGGTLKGINAIDGVNGIKAAAKTVTVSQTGGATSVQLTFSTGAINGVFSVSSSKKVQFSKGNLQYQASTKTWRFAANQWDIIGSENSKISENYDGWIDLFGWGTSGYNGKNPWMTSTTSTEYGNGEKDIAGTNYDWGVYNTISNGGGKSWRTLTKDEWVYVFNTRSTSSGIRYAQAIVNGVNGVILLPDNWSSSNYSLSNTNKTDPSFSSNRISQNDWQNKFEANGAVFLPAAGCRGGTNVFLVVSGGYYWSASYGGSDRAYHVYFSEGHLTAFHWHRRDFGRSVRLVCSAEN